MEARTHDPGDRLARRGHGRKEGEHRRPRRRRDMEPEGRLGDDPERPLRPDEQVRQCIPGDVLDVLAARPDHAPVGKDDLEAEDAVAGLAVLHATQPAGVRPEVPADRADLVARGVRGVEEALGGHRGLQLRVEDAGLGHDDQVRPVDLEHPVHPGEGDRHAALDPGRAAAQSGAGTARHHRDAMIGGEPDQRGDLGRGLRQGDRDRRGDGPPAASTGSRRAAARRPPGQRLPPARSVRVAHGSPSGQSIDGRPIGTTGLA